MVVKPKFLLPFFAAYSSWMGSPVSSLSNSCSYPDPVAIHNSGSVVLERYMNEDEGTFTMRVTYSAGYSWVGIGVNTAGDNGMIPGLAVIGRLEDDGELAVKRYRLSSDSKDASGVIALDDVPGHLRDASFVQTENGESILEFTHDLQILSEDGTSVLHTVTSDSAWIWAVGLADNVWEGKHQVHGSFTNLEMQDTCVLTTTTAPTGTQTESGTDESTVTPTEAGTDAADAADEAWEAPVGGGGAATTEAPVESGSVAATGAPVESGSIAPTEATDGSGTVDDQSGLAFAESDSAATRTLWVAHGILMGVAWGVFAPLGIGAAYLRNIKCLKRNGTWLQLHFYLGLSVAVLTICGFFIAVAATQQEGNLPHFADEVHRKAGLAIFILVLFQGCAGYFRPGLPTVASNEVASKESSAADFSRSSAEQDIDEIETKAGPSVDPGKADRKNGNDAAVPQKSKLRQYWEYLHRFLGICLLGLAWYNCQTGIILQAENYDQYDEQKWLDVFWGVTGGIAGMIFLVGYVIRLE